MIAVALVVAVATLVVLVGVSAVLSAAEAATRLLNRPRTRRLLESEVPGAAALESLMERPSRLASASAMWRALAYSLGAAVLGWAAIDIAPTASPVLAVLIGALVGVIVLFTLGEALPRTLAVQNPERVGLASAVWADRIAAVLSPVARALGAGWLGLTGLVVEEPVNDAWLTGDEYGTETADADESERGDAEEAFMEAVVDFANTIVRQVMVPRTDMVCLEDVTTVPEAVKVISGTGVSRVPVYHETLDDITGVLFAKDILACMNSEACPSTIGGIVRPAYFVPETKPVEELLVEMRQRKTHMALVADEYGGTAGLVTIEDLIEEIVGEIFDEYDRPEPMVTELADGGLLLDGRLSIDDFNDLMGTAIDLEADSIGGLFVELAGHIPTPGETVEVEGVRITAREVEGTRVRGLFVEPGTTSTAEEDEDA